MTTRVDVYYNLHKKCFSIRSRGKVVAHADTLRVTNASFVVQAGGRQRCLNEGRKNVHAFVRGNLDRTRANPDLDGYRQATYNPYRAGYFFDKEQGYPVYAAPDVILHEGKAYYRGIPVPQVRAS